MSNNTGGCSDCKHVEMKKFVYDCGKRKYLIEKRKTQNLVGNQKRVEHSALAQPQQVNWWLKHSAQFFSCPAFESKSVVKKEQEEENG